MQADPAKAAQINICNQLSDLKKHKERIIRNLSLIVARTEDLNSCGPDIPDIITQRWTEIEISISAIKSNIREIKLLRSLLGLEKADWE